MATTTDPETAYESEWLRGGGDTGARLRAIEWAHSPLGPLRTWPPWLRIVCDLLLASRAPMVLLVGPECVLLYNDAYRTANHDTPPLGTAQPAGFHAAAIAAVRERGEARCEGTTSYSPVRDEHGAVVAVLVAALAPDLDELSESAALLAAISDSSPDVIYAKDLQGRLRFANPATLALIGRRREDVLGKTDAEVLGDAEAARQVMENDRRVMDRGIASELEEIVPRPDGSPRVWLSRKVPYRDRQGRVTGLLGISTDITERKRAEAALRESEARFRSVVESMSEGLMIFDPDGNLIYQNPASRRIHGFPPDEEGRLDRTEVPITWEAWDERGRQVPFEEWPVSRVFRHERFRGQVLHVRRAGTAQEFHASYNGSPVYDAGGKLAIGFITIRDISDEVHALAALRESEELARASIDAAQLGTWRHDVRTDVLVLDARAAEHYGLPSGRVTLQELLAHVHPDDLLRLRLAVAETLGPESTGRYSIEYRTRTPDGTTRWLAVEARVRCEGEGPYRHPVSGFGTSQDITSRKLAEQALQDANDRLREADQRKDEFLAVLSHELRNPLAPIHSSVYVLEHAPPGGEHARRALAVISRQVQQLARLIDDLLDITRIGRGKATLQRRLLDLAALARDAADDHRAAFATSGVELALAIAEGPVWIDGDPARLSQVLGNLLNNSMKFTPRGGRTLLTVGTDDNAAVIRVLDTGVGLSAKTLREMFEPFTQAAQTIDRSRGGLGLGLSLVKGFVEMHGGTVHAASAGEGHGAELTVRLPLASPVPAP